jgi:hypothetical protein
LDEYGYYMSSVMRLDMLTEPAATRGLRPSDFFDEKFKVKWIRRTEIQMRTVFKRIVCVIRGLQRNGFFAAPPIANPCAWLTKGISDFDDDEFETPRNMKDMEDFESNIPPYNEKNIVTPIRPPVKPPPPPKKNNAAVVQEKNSEVVQEKNSEVVQEKNSEVVQEKNSAVVQEKNSEVVPEKNSEVVQEKNSVVVDKYEHDDDSMSHHSSKYSCIDVGMSTSAVTSAHVGADNNLLQEMKTITSLLRAIVLKMGVDQS